MSPRTTSYSELPAIMKWRTETAPGRIGGRANDPILRTIDDLVENLPRKVDGEYLYLLGQLFFTTMGWMHSMKRDPRMRPECRKPILSLNLYAGNELARVLGCDLGNLAKKLQEIYGVEMDDYGVDLDAKGSTRSKYYKVARREAARVFFVANLLCHYRTHTKRFKLLDCGMANAGGGREGFGFVLSMSNKLYVEDFVVGRIFHSFFMSGNAVQCAGMIQITNGRVTKIVNDSGHYRPSDPSLIKLVHFLSMNGIRPETYFVESLIAKSTVKGDVFARNHGNWNSILARADHQPDLRI